MHENRPASSIGRICRASISSATSITVASVEFFLSNVYPSSTTRWPFSGQRAVVFVTFRHIGMDL
jgi:hypothetical protein